MPSGKQEPPSHMMQMVELGHRQVRLRVVELVLLSLPLNQLWTVTHLMVGILPLTDLGLLMPQVRLTMQKLLPPFMLSGLLPSSILMQMVELGHRQVRQRVLELL